MEKVTKLLFEFNGYTLWMDFKEFERLNHWRTEREKALAKSWYKMFKG